MNTSSMLLQRNTPERPPLHRATGDLPDGLEVTLELAEGEAWSAEVPRAGAVLRCDRGALWVTVEGDWEDHLLAAGQTFTTSSHGRLAALALAPSAFRVEPTASLQH